MSVARRCVAIRIYHAHVRVYIKVRLYYGKVVHEPSKTYRWRFIVSSLLAGVRIFSNILKNTLANFQVFGFAQCFGHFFNKKKLASSIRGLFCYIKTMKVEEVTQFLLLFFSFLNYKRVEIWKSRQTRNLLKVFHEESLKFLKIYCFISIKYLRKIFKLSFWPFW